MWENACSSDDYSKNVYGENTRHTWIDPRFSFLSCLFVFFFSHVFQLLVFLFFFGDFATSFYLLLFNFKIYFLISKRLFFFPLKISFKKEHPVFNHESFLCLRISLIVLRFLLLLLWVFLFVFCCGYIQFHPTPNLCRFCLFLLLSGFHDGGFPQRVWWSPDVYSYW